MFNHFYKGKRVLVTGHTGFKGAWLCQWLLQLGADVAGFSLYIPSEPSLFEALGLAQRMSDHRGDIRKLEELQAVFDQCKPEIVFHLAAQPIVRASYDNPKLTFDTNLGGTVNVLEAIRSTPSVKTAVLITSDKCYENVEWEYGYRESDRLGGKDPYSASKACAEIAISAYWRSLLQNSDKKIASTRAGNVIGGGDWAKDRIVPDAMRAWSRCEPVRIRYPQATRPWQHVLEPLSGYLWLGAMLENKKVLAGESFNFGPSIDVTQPVVELLACMAKKWGPDAEYQVENDTSGKSEAGLLKLSCDKAWQHLNWEPSMKFAETVAMTTEWYKQYHHQSSAMLAFTQQQIAAYEQIAVQRDRIWAR